MVSVMSSPGDDDGSGHERNDQIKSMSSRNLRRRPNAAAATNGDYRVGSPERKHDGESDANGTGRQSVVGFPKSLTPFVHIQNTDAIEAELEAYENTSRSQSPDLKRQETDEEAQQLQNRTISYNRENSFHASFLTTDCSERSALADEFDLPEYSNRADNMVVDKQIGNALKDPPNVGSEGAESLQRQYRSYESENRDELSIKSGSDRRNTGTDSGSSSSNDGTSDPNTWLAKFQRSRRIVGRLVNNEYVYLTIIFLIVVNAILIGVSVTDRVRSNDALSARIDWADFGFLIIFTIEISMQFYYYGFGLFLDYWLVFDLLVVIISWYSTFWDAGGGQVLRSFRIFRGFRLVTRIKPLRDLVLALGEVLPRMSAIVLMLLLVFYVFAVMFTEQYKQLEMSQRYFSTLHDSLFTCFQMMTMEWVEICRELMDEHKRKRAWVFIVIYVMVAGFIVFNLIVAVVVEAVSATEETVRRLDGIESNSPASKLMEAQERIDLLQSHLSEMMEQQEHIQFMLEAMAGELLHLETERMKAKMRENRLKEEISRRIEYQKKMEEENAEEENEEEKKPSESFQTISMQFLQKIEAAKAQRKKEEEESGAQAELNQATSDQESMAGQSAKKPRKLRSRSSTKPISRDGSGKSFGTDSGDADSGISAPDIIDSPNQRSTTARKKSEIASAFRSGSLKGEGKDKSTSSKPEDSERKKKAIGNWKKLLAVQKDFDTS